MWHSWVPCSRNFTLKKRSLSADSFNRYLFIGNTLPLHVFIWQIVDFYTQEFSIMKVVQKNFLKKIRRQFFRLIMQFLAFMKRNTFWYWKLWKLIPKKGSLRNSCLKNTYQSYKSPSKRKINKNTDKIS